MKILCTICARGGSKGVKNKNIKLINKKPLISYTIKQAKKSKLFDKIVVSTDSKNIQKCAQKFGAESWFFETKKTCIRSKPKSSGNSAYIKRV